MRRYMPFEGTLIFVFVTSAYSCYKREMAEIQRAKSDTDIVESRRELKTVADNSVVSEGVATLKKSKTV